MEIQKLIRYFRDCYKADQRETNIWNIFDKRVEHLLFFSGNEELLTHNLPHLYLDKSQAESILSTLQLYKKEKELYYFSFFIAGKTGSETLGRQQICAPMLYYPAEIFVGDQEHYYFKIDLHRQQVNYPLISYLDNLDYKSYEEDLFDALPKAEITFSTSKQLIQALETYLTEVNFEEIYRYPEDLESEEELRLQSRQDHLKLLPASALGVITHSKTTRGVLNELAQMQGKSDFSTPLEAIFNSPQTFKKPKKDFFLTVPTLLSEAQKNILHAAQTNALNLVIGPPGTGKSFTIAALAIQCMNAGESVLIASKTDTALDVIADKIEKQIGIEGTLVRGGRSQYTQELKKYLEDILKGIGVLDKPSVLRLQHETLPQMTREFRQKEEHLTRLELSFQKFVQQEIHWAKYITDQENTQFFLRKWLFNYRQRWLQKRNRNSIRLWDLLAEMDQNLEVRNSLLKNYIQLSQQVKVRENLQNNRKVLSRFLKALKSRRDATQESLFQQIDFRIILQTFPIWLVNLSDIYHVLPLQKELFDLAIIDEASQCDIAASLPILQRAKRVVIVGDDQQLRHISFLSQLRQRQLMLENGLMTYDPEKLNYRESSILDLVRDSIDDQEQVSFLNEHYRSYPEIIQFSNQHFYRNTLHLMKQTPLNEKKDTVQLVRVSGKRSKQGYNIEEAQQIMARISEVLQEQSRLNPPFCHSIGILSPFRDQVDYISKLIPEHFSLQQIQKHDLMVGTAHSFQGNERDLMFISWVVDEEAAPGSLMHINKADVFNVSITRARLLQYVFSSVDSSRLNQNSLLYQYLSFIQKDHRSRALSLANHQKHSEHQFMEALEKSLKACNYDCFRAYPLAGLYVDLVVQYKDKTIGLDLIGYPGVFEDAFTLERYKMLNRAGLRIIPIPFTYWKYEQELCLRVIRETLEGESW